jgi:hypothetical protein
METAILEYKENLCRLTYITKFTSNVLQVKVKLSLYRPWRPLGLREVEAPTFTDIRLIDGGNVVSLTSRKIPGTHFC